MNEQSYFAIIPVAILQDRNLSANSKLLYGIITSFTRTGRQCYASNKYLADALSVEERSVQRPIAELKKAGYISVNIKNIEGRTMRTIKPEFQSEVDRGAIPTALNNGQASAIERPATTLNSGQISIDIYTNPKDNASTPTTASPKEFIDFFFNEYLSRFKIKYQVNGAKDCQIVKRLLKNHPLPKLKELATKFFESKDKFIQNSGYTIGIFYSTINKIQLEGRDGKSLVDREREQKYEVRKKSLV